MPAPRRLAAKLQLLQAARDARERTGKGVLQQLREIAQLRLGPGTLKPADYYALGAFDDAVYPPGAKRELVSWSQSYLSERVNNRHWVALASDKLNTYVMLKGLGLPFPELYALLHRRGRFFDGIPTLRSAEATATLLREGMRYPFFGKPLGRSFGIGAASVDGYNASTDRLQMATGEAVAVEEYVKQIARFAGYLFQRRVAPHPAIRAICGDRLGTVRMVVLYGEDGPRLFRCTWKTPVGRNITDHAIGRSGNLKAWVDPASGRVERVLQGLTEDDPEIYGLGRLGRETAVHPDSQAPVLGITLPDWDEAVALCLRAASAFPGLRYQSWDVAMTDEGPTLLELNSAGGVAQMPGCKGFCDAELRAFLTRFSS